MLDNPYRRFGKRTLDLALTIPALILLCPLITLLAAMVWLKLGRPVLFRQQRAGLHGEPFTLLKFRTMTNQPRVPDHEIGIGDPEVTRVGFWLRRFKLDELPQIMNIVKGEMSIVGPRPALPTQLSNYDEIGRKRLMVRPGLTGLAQVNGNICLSWPDRWAYDAAYVDRLSLWLDILVIWRTVAVVILGEERFLRQPGSLENGRRK